jgi:hypothetical protein
LTVGGLTQVIVDISDEDSNESTTSKNKVKSKISRTYFHWTLVFVIGYVIIVDEKDPKNSFFRVSLSTRFLLELALKTHHNVSI